MYAASSPVKTGEKRAAKKKFKLINFYFKKFTIFGIEIVGTICSEFMIVTILFPYVLFKSSLIAGAGANAIVLISFVLKKSKFDRQ